MCFKFDALPPVPAIAGAAVQHEDLTLTASDGTQLSAFSALADEPLGPAVVVMPDVRGLYRFYEELALRFAERGYDSIAIDYFGRTAGLGKRGEDFDFWPEVKATTAAGVSADVRAASDMLRNAARARRTAPSSRSASWLRRSSSWQQAVEGHGLAGVISASNGMPTTSGSTDSAPVDRPRRRVRVPGARDSRAAPTETSRRSTNDSFQTALSEAGVEHLVISYHGAPHSFFRPHRRGEPDRLGGPPGSAVLAFIENNS